MELKLIIVDKFLKYFKAVSFVTLNLILTETQSFFHH